ncbi:MAG: sulfurtransferase TusA family protein [Dehalococcoidia bacterium]
MNKEERNLVIAGTVPVEDLPLTVGEARLDGSYLDIDGYRIPCAQGTGAMVSAALVTLSYLKVGKPWVVTAGDIGKGGGSRQILEYLSERLPDLSPKVLALHYCLPDLALMKRLQEAVDKCPNPPKLVADASSMYGAKAAGLAEKFDLFTPDATEIAFLADPEASHPSYINKHLFNADASQATSLIAQAYKVKGASKALLVKGSVDYIVNEGEILETVSEPDIPAMEAIGGTGDSITGLVSAFIYAGLELHEAAIIAAKANRMAGEFAQASGATPVSQIIEQLPAVFGQYLCYWSGVCTVDPTELSYHEGNTMIEIDVRGLSCPIPVVKTKKAIEGNPGETISVLVETAVSKENVSRLANSRGYSITVETLEGEEYRLELDPPRA